MGYQNKELARVAHEDLRDELAAGNVNLEKLSKGLFALVAEGRKVFWASPPPTYPIDYYNISGIRANNKSLKVIWEGTTLHPHVSVSAGTISDPTITEIVAQIPENIRKKAVAVSSKPVQFTNGQTVTVRERDLPFNALADQLDINPNKAYTPCITRVYSGEVPRKFLDWVKK